MMETAKRAVFKPLKAAEMLYAILKIYPKYGRKLVRSGFLQSKFYNELERKYNFYEDTFLWRCVIGIYRNVSCMTIDESRQYTDFSMLVAAFDFVRLWGICYCADARYIEREKLRFLKMYGTWNLRYIDIAFSVWDEGLFPSYESGYYALDFKIETRRKQ